MSSPLPSSGRRSDGRCHLCRGKVPFPYSLKLCFITNLKSETHVYSLCLICYLIGTLDVEELLREHGRRVLSSPPSHCSLAPSSATADSTDESLFPFLPNPKTSLKTAASSLLPRRHTPSFLLGILPQPASSLLPPR